MLSLSVKQLDSAGAAQNSLIATRRPPWFWFVLCLLPAIGTFWLIRHFGVDVPYWDEWCHLDVLVRAAEHRLTFASIIAQHNEERPFFPRLWLLFTTLFGHWNQQAQDLSSLALACMTVVALMQVACDTCGRAGTTLIAAFIGSLLIFSWAQWEAWLWGFGIDLFVPPCCLYIGWAISNRNWRLPVRLILCALLAFIAQFSFADGLFLWVCLSPIVLMVKPGPDKIRSVVAGAIFWIAAAAASFALYFHNYVHQTDWPTLQIIWENRVGEIESILAFLGYPIMDGWPLFAARFAGGIILCLFALALAILLFTRSRASQIWRVMPWLMIAAFVLMSAGVMVMFRVRLGTESGVAPRYAVTGAHFLLATIFLLLLASRQLQWRSSGRVSRLAVAAPLVLAAGAGVWGVLFYNASTNAIPAAYWFYRANLRCMTELQFTKLVRDHDAEAKLLWRWAPIIPQFMSEIYVLDQHGYIRPHLLDEDHFQKLIQRAPRIASRPSNVEGILSSVQREPNGDIDLNGWAWNLRTDAPAASVIFTYRGTDQREHPMGMALDYEMGNSGVPATLGSTAMMWAGWSRHLAAITPALKTQLTITAWVYDPIHCQLWRLANTLKLPAMLPGH